MLDFSNKTITPDDVRAMRRDDHYRMVNYHIMAMLEGCGSYQDTPANIVARMEKYLSSEDAQWDDTMAFDLPYAMDALAHCAKRRDYATYKLWLDECRMMTAHLEPCAAMTGYYIAVIVGDEPPMDGHRLYFVNRIAPDELYSRANCPMIKLPHDDDPTKYHIFYLAHDTTMGDIARYSGSISYDFAIPEAFRREYAKEHNGASPIGIWVYDDGLFGNFLSLEDILYGIGEWMIQEIDDRIIDILDHGPMAAPGAPNQQFDELYAVTD